MASYHSNMGYFFQLLWGFILAIASGGSLWRALMVAYGLLVAGGSLATGTTPGRAMLTEIGAPDIGPWQFGTVAGLVGILFFVGRISYLVTPRLQLVGLLKFHDGQGYWFRAKIRNISWKDTTTMRVVLERIRKINPLIAPHCPFPLVLTTQQRLIRSNIIEAQPDRTRFNLMANEEKNIALFRVDGMRMHISHENGEESAILDDYVLDFRVTGFGQPLQFSIRLYSVDAGFGYCLIRNEFDELALEQIEIR